MLPAEQMRRLISEATQLGQRLRNASAAEWREELAGVLDKVTLDGGRIRIQFSQYRLMVQLGAQPESIYRRNEHWTCEIPYKLRNRGRQLRILPDGVVRAIASEPDATLLKLLRRAHDWRRQLETGPPRTVSDLAAANGVNSSYFTRVIRIAYLAPDIIQAIVEGKQPPELTANRLVRLKNLPVDWPGQREYLGFPAP